MREGKGGNGRDRSTAGYIVVVMVIVMVMGQLSGALHTILCDSWGGGVTGRGVGVGVLGRRHSG